MDVEKFQDIDGLVNLDFCEELNNKLEKLSNSLIEEEESSFKHSDTGVVEELDMTSPKPFHADSDDEINASSTPKKKKFFIQSDSEDDEEKPPVNEEERDSASDFDIKEYGSQEELQKSLKKCSQKSHVSSHETGEPSASSWVQCDRTGCQKWRRVDNVDDMVTLANGRWVCSMSNDERRNNCELSQESLPDEEEDESVYTSYKPGTLVLGKMVGYPWWPGIVEDDPDFDSFFHLEHKKDRTIVSYHITFLDKEVSRAWLADYSVRPFTGQEDLKDLGTVSFSGKNYARSVTKAIFEAKKVMELSSEKRIRKYGFLRRFNQKRKIGNKKELTSDVKDDNVTEAVLLPKDKSSKATAQKEEKKQSKKKKVGEENSSNPAKPTARKMKENKLEKKKRKLEKLEAEREKLKQLKSLKIAAEKLENASSNELEHKVPDGEEIGECTKETCDPEITEKDPASSQENKECSEKDNDAGGPGSADVMRIRTIDKPLDTELTESELYAEKMFNKYIDEERLKALIDTPEQIQAKKQKAEELKKLKEEKANKRRKSKELKTEERQKSKELKAEGRQKSKELKAEERQKSKELKAEERQKSKELKAEERQKEEKTEGKVEHTKKDISKNAKEQPENIKKTNETNNDKPSETPCNPQSENLGEKNKKISSETGDTELKLKEETNEVKTGKGNGKESKNADKTNSKEKPSKEKRKEKSKPETKSSKTKESSKKSKVPKLIKPDIPNVNIDEIIENKTDKPVPNLVKPVFKVPKKKKSSSFQAPTKNKAVGGKRPRASPKAGNLEIDNEPPTKKRNTDLETNMEPPAKKPHTDLEVDEEPLSKKMSATQEDEVNIGTLLMDNETTSKTTEILHDSLEF